MSAVEFDPDARAEFLGAVEYYSRRRICPVRPASGVTHRRNLRWYSVGESPVRFLKNRDR
jgi:hypothetical protein